MTKAGIYPHLTISLIKNPKKWYAIPLLGGLVKIILLIPVAIELFALSIIGYAILIIGALVILFTGKYWKVEYEYYMGFMRLQAKTYFYFAGLTDTYPGFSLDAKGFTLDIDYPNHPNRWFAVPLLGFIVRIALLIPFSIYRSIIQTAGILAVLFSWITVLLFGTYPETTHELVRDAIRLSLAETSYIAGLSDIYPNFWISLNHKALKLLLIILAALFMMWNYTNNSKSNKSNKPQNNQRYQYNFSSNQPAQSY